MIVFTVWLLAQEYGDSSDAINTLFTDACTQALSLEKHTHVILLLMTSLALFKQQHKYGFAKIFV